MPGGAHRVWLTKISAALFLLVVSLLLQGSITYAFFTSFPPLTALFGAFQGVAFYMAVSMGLSTLFRSEVAGAMATAAILGFNGLVTGFGANPVRISPFWNPLSLTETDPQELLALSVQNRIGFVLAIAAIVALTFGRAERRETMLG